MLSTTVVQALEEAFADEAARAGLAHAGVTDVSDHRARLRYEGRRAVLLFMMERGELDAAVGQRSPVAEPGEPKNPPFGLGLILGVAGVQGWRERWPRLVRQESVGEIVTAMVTDLRQFGRPWLEGDARAYRRLSDFREVDRALRMERFAEGRREAEVWSAIEEAWAAQRLGELHRRLYQLGPPLRPGELKALKFAGRYRDNPIGARRSR